MRALLFAWAAAWVLTAVASGAAARTSAPEDDLPPGEGKKILLAACTMCHELSEITKFKGYYTRAEWRDIVVTMVEYGAPVDERQVDVLADYLAAHLGKKQP